LAKPISVADLLGKIKSFLPEQIVQDIPTLRDGTNNI